MPALVVAYLEGSMAYVFGKISKGRLTTCDPQLQTVILEVMSLQLMDFAITGGFRNKEVQDEYFRTGKSKVKWPNSKHNSVPSKAVDVVPYVNGEVSYQRDHCVYLAGLIMAIATELGVKIRWGGNWDQDGEVITDQSFQDLVHFEVME